MLYNSQGDNIFHHPLKGESGLPEHYPTPSSQNLLFYIQRNRNQNTIIYEINRLHDGSVNQEYPMHVFWLRYSDKGEQRELNYIQNQLAYGYRSTQLCQECYEFNFIAYETKQFFIDKKADGNYGVFTSINSATALLTNIYVYADELGVFPKVKYFELYGYCNETSLPVYQKIEI